MSSSSSNIAPRVRFAPSPTGALHLGSAFVALANAAFARAGSGTLVLRIDDTDQSRSRDEDVDDLLRLLRWLGIDWDEGPIYQSTRSDLYRGAVEQLMDRGMVYPCFCGTTRLDELRSEQIAAGQPPRYDGRCRLLEKSEAAKLVDDGAPHVVRFAVPSGRDVTFSDLVHGQTTVPEGSFGDPILYRSDGSVGYLFASVVDDIDLKISHVIRGEDHLSNTARQILLFEALGADYTPRFAHLPLLRSTAGRKLSKRDPLGTLDELADEAFLPVSVRRYLAELLGCGAVDLLSSQDNESKVSFGLSLVPAGSSPRVDRVRLESLGREDMTRMPISELLAPFSGLSDELAGPLVRELAQSSASMLSLRGELRLVVDGPGPGDLVLLAPLVLPDEGARVSAVKALDICIKRIRENLQKTVLESAWESAFITRIREDAANEGMKPAQLLKPLRLALTGKTSGPGLDLILATIGANEALRRLHVATMVLGEQVVEADHF